MPGTWTDCISLASLVWRGIGGFWFSFIHLHTIVYCCYACCLMLDVAI